ncbi:MAG: ATP-dependent helicase, partial [Bacteroidota bacterium]|nr:ATP-dependent helicase [Bacteroidota bacterium]
LFQVLHCDFFSLSPLDIAKLNLQANAKKRGGGDDPWSLRRLMAESPQPKPDLFSQSEPPSIKSISDRLESLLKASASVTLQQLLEQVIQKAGIIAYIMQSPEKPWLMQVLNAFFQQLKEENKRNPDLDLATWLDNLELMRKNRLPVPLYKITSSEAGVNMVTAHGAKGSEFEHVFVIGCTENIWDEKGAGSKNDYKLPDNLVSNHGADAMLEENRRLFYVAITRAKSYLQVSYAAKDEKDKTTVKSSFVGELIETGSLQLEEKQVNDDLMADYTLLQFAEKARPEIALVEEAYLGDLLKRYTLSVTHLNNFLDCPLKFYYQNLIKVPAAKNDAMAFGSAIHWAIERLFVKMKNNNGQFPPKEDLLADFNWHMQNNREAFTPEAFKLKTDYGAKILPAYYDYHIHRWNKIIIAEKQVRNVTVANVPINGKLDKLEFNGKLVNVVDYKTGSYQNAKKKLAPPHEALPNGGDYWRQAVFYKILLDNDSTNDWLVTSTEFDFIEPVDETYKTEKIAVSAADIATVTHQITDTWAKIQSRQFKVGCGKPDCEWCRFVKTNGMAVDLHPSEEEV